ncbi:glycosyltransferase family 4 protein [Mycolicibacterium sp. BiH015]|uniref:glycosyltransferase family 4 protein n=1 Tax=Mycolicibacterium sp. BiH015 TaxID=3018808 RepID=UPI0022E03A6F|nr:glycosyltransferase family 4 protein [Mycolicibacterium sp. BiH015]MDA2895489.1 glycosyltransferase family 4 protein [Mycolicibacterium sp. BiH015]
MFAVDRWSRARRRADKDGPKQRSVARVVMVSNVSNFGGGGVVGFREMLMAIRTLRPDLDVVAVYPQRGDQAVENARNGVTTTVAWTPWWAFGKWSRSRHLDAHAVIGGLPYALFLIPGIVQALLLLSRLRPEVVVSNTITIPSHAIAAKLLGIPHYWMVREFGRQDHRLWFLFGYRATVRLVGRLSEAVICNSRAVEQALLTQDPTLTTHVLYPAVDTPVGTPSRRRPGERMRAILVGYFSPSKGQTLAIEAISIARGAGVDIALTLIGSGNRKPLTKLARDLDVEDLVTFHEPTRNLGPHWAAAHVGLMCSECEAFGRVTVEAMRAGLPVCGTDSGGTPEIIDPGVAGLLSPAGDARALAANLMTLEADEGLRHRLALCAVQRSQRFGRDRHDEQFVAILGLG